MSAVLCTYAAGYFLWTVYMRHRPSVSPAFEQQRGWVQSLWKDLCHALALYWILLMVSLLTQHPLASGSTPVSGCDQWTPSLS